MITQKLLNKYPIISEQMTPDRLLVVLTELEKTLDANVPGDIVELGCYIGTTSLFIRRMLDEHPNGKGRELHVYDSFAGLPSKTNQDSSPVGLAFVGGELMISKKKLIQEFQKANLKLPIIHKGWFSELKPEDLPNNIAFGFLDGDFYQSIKDSLELVWPHLNEQGTVTIDDCLREALPGVSKAANEFFNKTKYSLKVKNNIGIVNK
jgi:O-methyltransferase